MASTSLTATALSVDLGTIGSYGVYTVVTVVDYDDGTTGELRQEVEWVAPPPPPPPPPPPSPPPPPPVPTKVFVRVAGTNLATSPPTGFFPPVSVELWSPDTAGTEIDSDTTGSAGAYVELTPSATGGHEVTAPSLSSFASVAYRVVDQFGFEISAASGYTAPVTVATDNAVYVDFTYTFGGP